MKADSSRAIAVATTVGRLPFRVSDRKRPDNLICAFQAISRTALGAVATFICFSRLTRGGCRLGVRRLSGHPSGGAAQLAHAAKLLSVSASADNVAVHSSELA